MLDMEKLDFSKGNGLIPAIVTDFLTKDVLMLGYMNKEAVEKTIEEKKVTFFSRSRNKLWTKGETSGNFLILEEISSDCDNDSLLVKARPAGPVCHKGTKSCFEEENQEDNYSFLSYLFDLIKNRKLELPENSYTTRLFRKGSDKIIQKVGEEAVETVIAAKNKDKDEIINETSDLVFHLFVMLNDQNIPFQKIVDNLKLRHK